MWKQYNPNPAGRSVGDCSIRALTRALRIPWEEAYARACSNGYLMGDMPSADAVWGSVLRQAGFKRYAVPNTCPDCYTLAAFAEDHPEGVYVVGTGGHVATVEGGDIYDSWDSSEEVAIYYWHREDDNGIRQ